MCFLLCLVILLEILGLVMTHPVLLHTVNHGRRFEFSGVRALVFGDICVRHRFMLLVYLLFYLVLYV